MCPVNVTCLSLQTSLSLSQVVWVNGSCFANSPTSQIIYETISNLSQCSVEQTESESRPQHYDTIEVTSSPAMVGRLGQPSQRVVLGETNSQNCYDNQYITNSMGFTLQWEESSRPLELTTGQDAYQCTGIVGSMEGSESFSAFPSPQRSVDSDGQHISPGVVFETRSGQSDPPDMGMAPGGFVCNGGEHQVAAGT